MAGADAAEHHPMGAIVQLAEQQQGLTPAMQLPAVDFGALIHAPQLEMYRADMSSATEYGRALTWLAEKRQSNVMAGLSPNGAPLSGEPMQAGNFIVRAYVDPETGRVKEMYFPVGPDAGASAGTIGQALGPVIREYVVAPDKGVGEVTRDGTIRFIAHEVGADRGDRVVVVALRPDGALWTTGISAARESTQVLNAAHAQALRDGVASLDDVLQVLQGFAKTIAPIADDRVVITGSRAPASSTDETAPGGSSSVAGGQQDVDANAGLQRPGGLPRIVVDARDPTDPRSASAVNGSDLESDRAMDKARLSQLQGDVSLLGSLMSWDQQSDLGHVQTALALYNRLNTGGSGVALADVAAGLGVISSALSLADALKSGDFKAIVGSSASFSSSAIQAYAAFNEVPLGGTLGQAAGALGSAGYDHERMFDVDGDGLQRRAANEGQWRFAA